MNSTSGGERFRSVCDHPRIVHKAVPVAARTPLMNHWLVCLVCGTKVVLSLYTTPSERARS